MRYSPDGEILAVVVNNDEVRFWSVKYERLLHKIKRRYIHIMDITFSNSGKFFGLLTNESMSILVLNR